MGQPQNRSVFPNAAAPSDRRLTIAMEVETPSTRVSLNDTPYRLTEDTMADTRTQWRRQEVQSPFLGGSFLVNALEENSTVNLGIYVTGESHYELDTYLSKLYDAFSQFSYKIYYAIGDWPHYEVWTCTPADFTVQTQREFLHARMAVLRAEVPRMPGKQLVER